MRVLKIRQVSEKLGGRHPVSIWRDVREGRFPKPIAIGPNSRAWISDEVDQWLEDRIKERDQKA